MQINQRVTPSQVERQTNLSLSQTRETSTPAQSPNPSAFKAKSDPTLAQTPEISQAETEAIQQNVSQVPPESLEQESENLPQPGSLQAQLQKQAGQLKHVTSQDRSGLQESFRQDFIAEARHNQGLLQHTNLETRDVDRAHREVSLSPLAELAKEPIQNFNQAYIKYAQSGQAQSFLATELQFALKDLSKADTLIGGEAKIAKSLHKTEAQIKSLVGSLSSNLNLSVYLANQSDDQLRQLVMDSVGQSKGYDQSAQLSPKKLQFVESVMKGIKAGLPEQGPQGLDLKRQQVPEGHRGELAQAIPQFGPDMQARIQTAVSAYAPDSDMIWTLTLKSDAELVSLLDQNLGGGVPKAYLQSLVDTLNQSLPNQLSSELTETGEGLMPQSIQIDGKTYDQPKFLAAGAFGKVFEYVNPDDTTDKVVVKQPIPPDNVDPMSLRQETVNELIAHREILGEGHENIIGLKGALKAPDKQIYIVLEHAAGGNLYEAAGKLDASVAKGLISADARQLLGTFLLQGVLEGTRHMQETRQAHHGDFKTPNILIGADGKAKLTDFGTSGVGLQKQMTENAVENPKWLSPELIGQDFGKIKAQAKNHVFQQVFLDHQAQIDGVFDSVKDQDFSTRIEKAVDRNTVDSLKLSHPDIYQELNAVDKNTIASQLREGYPEIDESLQGQVKLYLINNVVDHLKQAGQIDAHSLKSLLRINADLERHYLGNSQATKGTEYTRYLEQGEAYLQSKAVDVSIAKADTWSAGIVATELLITSLQQNRAGDFQHIQKMKLNSEFNSKIGASIVEIARNDLRVMAKSSDLNLNTLAESRELSIQDLAGSYAQDPRFQGEAYVSLFDRLQQAPPPMAPDSESPEVQADYQQKLSQFKAEHGLDDEGMSAFQARYTQDLNQFKAVLQTEMDMGVSAQDRLINGLAHPDPAKRITMQAALQNSIFADPRLAMPEVTELWQEVNAKTPDPQKIQNLIQALGI